MQFTLSDMQFELRKYFAFVLHTELVPTSEIRTVVESSNMMNLSNLTLSSNDKPVYNFYVVSFSQHHIDYLRSSILQQQRRLAKRLFWCEGKAAATEAARLFALFTTSETDRSLARSPVCTYLTVLRWQRAYIMQINPSDFEAGMRCFT
jgi:hypothetical protein